MQNSTHNSPATLPTFKSYLIGFLLSIALILVAYFAVTNAGFSGIFGGIFGSTNTGSVSTSIVIIIFACAIVQFFVQLTFFLHLGKGPDARWNWFFLSLAILVVGILVGGSLWIMTNLNYNMTPDQMNASMLDQAE
jgi:cytochrome o ubiquinol oxidase operon protein cyoD